MVKEIAKELFNKNVYPEPEEYCKAAEDFFDKEHSQLYSKLA